MMPVFNPQYDPARMGIEADRLVRAMEACKSLAVPWEGVLFRFSKIGYANQNDLLSGLGAYHVGGRFNLPGCFPIVYTSEDDETAMAEVRHYAHQLGWKTLLPRVLAGVEARFIRVLDLSPGSAALQRLKVTQDQLQQEWEPLMAQRQEALAQMIGRLAYDAGFEGLRVPSARGPGINLNYFPDRIDRVSSSLQILNLDELPQKKSGKSTLSS